METILVNVEAHVATITINRPKALNALSTQVLTELNAALDEVNENKDVYCVIIRWLGKTPVAIIQRFMLQAVYQTDESRRGTGEQGKMLHVAACVRSA